MGVERLPPPKDCSLQFDLAREADDPEIRRLLRENPLEGRIQLSMEREPNSFWASALQGDLHQVVVARDGASGRLLGMGARSVMNAYVNGRVTRLGYLSQLRLDRDYRGKTRMLKAGYARLRELHRDGATPFYVTTIVEDNRPARRVLEAGIDGLPIYQALEPFVTLTLPVQRGRERRQAGPSIDRCDPRGLDAIVPCLERNASRYQFAPCRSGEDLLSPERGRGLRAEDFYVARRGDRTLGCLAIWDQRHFKQTVVRAYQEPLNLLRPLLNLVSPWVRAPRLPPAGAALRNAFISHAAVDDDDPEVFLALLQAAHSDAMRRDLDLLTLGLARRSPLLDPVRRSFTHVEYVSILYLVYWEDGRQAAAEVDGRIPHLEVAIL